MVKRRDIGIPEIHHREIFCHNQHTACCRGSCRQAVPPPLRRKPAAGLRVDPDQHQGERHIDEKDILRDGQVISAVHHIFGRSRHGQIREFDCLRPVLEIIVVHHGGEQPPDQPDAVGPVALVPAPDCVQDQKRNSVHQNVEPPRLHVVEPEHVAVEKLQQRKAEDRKEQRAQKHQLMLARQRPAAGEAVLCHEDAPAAVSGRRRMIRPRHRAVGRQVKQQKKRSF